MEIITVINQKGGVGKSTTAQAIGVGLQNKGYKVLLIDLDAQTNLSYITKASLEQVNILDVLLNKAEIDEAIQKTDTIDIIVANKGLAVADSIFTATGKEYRLAEEIKALKNQYDFIIIDTPPALNILTINALTCSDRIIIPAQADILSLQGIGQLNDTINTVKKYTNPNLSILGIVLTRYSARTVLAKEVTAMAKNMAKKLNARLFESKIREGVAVKEAQINRIDLFSYAKKSNSALDYQNLVNEIELQIQGEKV